jgi:hypothetical protein
MADGGLQRVRGIIDRPLTSSSHRTGVIRLFDNPPIQQGPFWTICSSAVFRSLSQVNREHGIFVVKAGAGATVAIRIRMADFEFADSEREISDDDADVGERQRDS